MLVLGRHEVGACPVLGMDEWLELSLPDGTRLYIGITKISSGRKVRIGVNAPDAVVVERVLCPSGVEPLLNPDRVLSQPFATSRALKQE